MKHIVNVTISNPAHDFVSMRSRQSTTNYMVEAKNEAEAILRASRHFKSLGHYVHNAVIVEQNINEGTDQIQINEAMQVRAYDKNGKLVGNYRSMADAKKFKPGHNYKTVKENVESIDEVNARHSPEAAQAVLTPTAKIVRAAVGKSARDKAATKKYARRVANISPHYSKKDVMDHLKNMGEEVEQIDEALDHEVNKYAQHMLNAHSADDLHVGNEHRDMAHQTLQDIKKNYGPVGIRWAEARAGEHIENHNKAQREAEKASIMKRYKPTPPGAKVYQYPKSEVKEEVVNEKAPPGAKYERMVKHIKDKYSEDGTLTPKEKAIAYATAWKAKNSGK